MKGRRWESPYYDILNEHKGPWVIAKVCRRWRDIALSCPKIWASFSLLEHHETMQHWTADLTRDFNSPRYLTKMAENALRRSANVPLRIYLVLPLPGTTKHRESLDRVLAIIMEHSHRWKDVRILADESRMFSLSHT
ncbi:hypothetical protein EDD85DRAFT_242403 [Armillaria nabsnona]|nr:hypothetical protein EDD85DRAFT_242403 [Armillaria nabsnona]